MIRRDMSNYFRAEDGIYQPVTPVLHRDDEYSEAGFKTLLEMQDRHFWYRGRHRFLMKAVDRFLPDGTSDRAAIDLGGGVGGWVRDLERARRGKFKRLALADSSLVALRKAGDILPVDVERYQIDLMDLRMEGCWDAAFCRMLPSICRTTWGR